MDHFVDEFGQSIEECMNFLKRRIEHVVADGQITRSKVGPDTRENQEGDQWCDGPWRDGHGQAKQALEKAQYDVVCVQSNLKLLIQESRQLPGKCSTSHVKLDDICEGLDRHHRTHLEFTDWCTTLVFEESRHPHWV